MSEHAKPRLGLSIPVIIGLAALGVPRLVLHDLHLIDPGSPLNAVLAIGPPLAWIAVVVLRRVDGPFPTVSAIGACYGAFLAVGHQIMWTSAMDGATPRLGGNLASMDPAAQDVLIRVFAVPSSLFTGIVVGVVAGLVAWGIATLRRRTDGTA